MSLAIHWFRRDLRLRDNTALNAAVAAHDRILPVYILSDWKKSHPWTGPGRQQFLCNCLASLGADLEKTGSPLVLRQGDAVAEIERLIDETGATAVYTNRDPDPFGQRTEARLEAALAKRGVPLHVFKDVALHEREEVLTGGGTPFRVFTPYSRAWFKLSKAVTGRTVQKLPPPAKAPASLPLPTLATWQLPLDAADSIELPDAGEKAAARRLELFLHTAGLEYAGMRDLPAAEGTSRISQDLRYGTLSIRDVFAQVEARAQRANAEQLRSLHVFQTELCWREFYFQVLWFHPEVLESEYSEAYRGLPWIRDEANFQKWCHGQTGFPIVDAGMRQLLRTGFMHNRVRMIVAMFLTKDLHMDWRQGERWFLQHLLDGEIASNNGGWQWSAGTGTDAAPYFRIQNPWTQGLRFDEAGEYIKRWVPELRPVPAAQLHRPPSPGLRLVPSYPLPLVDHGRERDIALDTYKSHLKKSRP
jgi:deoxyribodipyrimidine photo-lyase